MHVENWAAGCCVEKRLAMLCTVGRERRNACGDVPIGSAAETSWKATVNSRGSALILLRVECC
jgi:hypothetical protein